MKIQIFQHLPALPKAGIFCPLPILCVAFRTFIPDRSVFRCSPLPCLSMFRPLIPMHKSAHPVTHPAAPPSHAPATPITTPAASQYPRTPTPTAPLPAQATGRQHQGGSAPTPAAVQPTRPRAALTRRTRASHRTAAHQHPPPHVRTGHQTPAPRDSAPTPSTVQPATPPHTNPHSRSAHLPSPSSYSHPPPHTQASKKDCPAQEQSCL